MRSIAFFITLASILIPSFTVGKEGRRLSNLLFWLTWWGEVGGWVGGGDKGGGLNELLKHRWVGSLVSVSRVGGWVGG